MSKSILNYLLYSLAPRSTRSWILIESVVQRRRRMHMFLIHQTATAWKEARTTAVSRWSYRDGPLWYNYPSIFIAVYDLLPSLSATDLVHAQTRTRLLFESDIASLKAEQIASAFKGDPQLIIISKAELFHSAAVKLAAKYRLTSSASTCFRFAMSRLPIPFFSFYSRRAVAGRFRGILH